MDRRAILLLGAFLSACAGRANLAPPAAETERALTAQAALDAATLPPPLPRIVATPALAKTVAESVLAFRDAHPARPGETAYDALRLVIEVFPVPVAVETVAAGQAELVVAGGSPPDGWFATPLGKLPVAIVVHPSNPIRAIGLRALQDIFLGLASDWEGVSSYRGTIQAVAPLEGDEIRILLTERILEGGKLTPTALLAPTPEAMIQLVADQPGSIGLLPLSELDSRVRMVSIEGFAADLTDSGYPLVLHMLGYAPQEPAGAVRDWIAWLQASQLSSDR